MASIGMVEHWKSVRSVLRSTVSSPKVNLVYRTDTLVSPELEEVSAVASVALETSGEVTEVHTGADLLDRRVLAEISLKIFMPTILVLINRRLQRRAD